MNVENNRFRYLPAEKEKVRTSKQCGDDDENVFIVKGTSGTTGNHQRDNAVRDEQHCLAWA